MPIFDAHAHAFPDAVAPGAMKSLTAHAAWEPVNHFHDGTVGGLLATMDRAGVDRAILCSVATKPGQVKKITDWSASIASSRVVPFASIHPDFDDVEEEVQRIASLGIRGLKFHPQYMDCAADDPRAIRIARAAAAAELAMTFHAGYDLSFPKDEQAAPRQIRALLESAPGLRLLACHMGGWNRWEEVLDCLAGQPLWFETSYSLRHCPRPMLQKLLERHDPRRIMFGTDSPWADQARELELFYNLPMTSGNRRLALWQNAEEFVGGVTPA